MQIVELSDNTILIYAAARTERAPREDAEDFQAAGMHAMLVIDLGIRTSGRSPDFGLRLPRSSVTMLHEVVK
jgi:hypothetical protein